MPVICKKTLTSYFQMSNHKILFHFFHFDIDNANCVLVNFTVYQHQLYSDIQ